MKKKIVFTALLLGIMNLFGSASYAQSDVQGPCSTPRRAVAQWYDRALNMPTSDEVIRCAVKPTAMSKAEFLEAMLELRQVLDWRGIALNLATIPDEAGYINPNNGLEQYELSGQLPGVYLFKKGQEWVFDSDVVAKVPGIFAGTTKFGFRSLSSHFPSWAVEPLFGVQGITLWQIGLLFILILIGFLIRALMTFLVVMKMKYVMARLRVSWAKDLLRAAAMPLGNLAMCAQLALMVPSLEFHLHIAQILSVSIRTFAAISAVLLVYRSVDVLAAFLADKAALTDTKLDDQIVPLVRRGLKIITVLVGIIFVLQNLKVDVTSLLAGVTIGGLAFTLAAKDTVSNLFGSITIFLDKPFSVGDWVNTAGVEGIVETVGFRSTRIRTFYNSLVYVPNNKFTETIVDNYGMRQYRRCVATLQLNYKTSPEQIEAFCEGIRKIILSHAHTRKDLLEIHFAGFGDWSLNIMLYYFFEVKNWSEELTYRHQIYITILKLAKSLNIEFAYPTRTIQMDPKIEQEIPA